MTRPARVVIDLDALRHNLSRVRELAPRARVMAILKADAYGHGIERAARALGSANAFGVACLEEAQQLRDAGVRKPVVLLEGPYSGAELPLISSLGLEIVIHHAFQLDLLESARLSRPAKAWLKVDTGMHRLGFDPDRTASAWRRLLECESVARSPRLMTHLALANQPGSAMTGEQLRVFDQICGKLPGERSIANSAAILSLPASHADWVRPGLMLYGVSPFDSGTGAEYGLQPVMALQSELISIRRLRRGDPVGYGANWRCPEDMDVGVVAAGYGDGFPRHASTGTPVMVCGRQSAIIGFASMDMLAVDLRGVPQARVGDAVELWGEARPIEDIARSAGTVPYEILCGVHKRLRFVEHGEAQDTVSM
ncbi:MAG: alanine racemase [Gammaproteobacteria bacterium]|nr:alanine racemase [Gammaproteobacteria bacterium]